MKNSKIILDLCGGTGAWSKPYAEAGYDVRLVTLPEYDIRSFRFDSTPNIHGILSAPPCTEFSLAKGNRPRYFGTAMEIVEACLRIIWSARISGDLKWWCMENPVGLLRQFLGKPAWTFEQWQFGELLIKRTDLWGYFKRPKPTVRHKPEEQMTIRYPNGKANGRFWAKPSCPAEYAHLNLSRAALRAITPPGFARAFFEANP